MQDRNSRWKWVALWRAGLFCVCVLAGRCSYGHPITGVVPLEPPDADPIAGFWLLAALAPPSVSVPAASTGGILLTDAAADVLIRLEGIAGGARLTYDGSTLGNPFANPAGVATDSLGRIYVAGTDRLYRFDDMTGANQVEYDGSAGTSFARLRAVHLDRNDRIYVTDNMLTRLYRFDDMSGTNQVELSDGWTNP